MRALLVVAALIAPTIASAAPPEAADCRSIQDPYEGARCTVAQGRAYRAASQKALCDRVGGVAIGDTAEAVRKSCWGKPLRINVTLTESRKREQWVYPSGYIYFTDGAVTMIQANQ